MTPLSKEAIEGTMRYARAALKLPGSTLELDADEVESLCTELLALRRALEVAEGALKKFDEGENWEPRDGKESALINDWDGPIIAHQALSQIAKIKGE